MKHKISYLSLVLFFLASSGCKFKENSEVLYILSKVAGGEKKTAVSEEKFQGILAQTVFRSHRSTLEVLSQKEEKDIHLSRVTLGLELEAEAGIGNIMKLAGETAFELRFEKLPAPK
ncbi:MAG: hypothetical protein ACXVCY_19480 [Pseudobdellovibrionaceae bacterium]